MPTIEALSAGIGAASPSVGIGGGIESFSSPVSSELSSGLSGGHFSSGSIDFNNFAAFDSLNFPSPDTFERSEIFDFSNNYQITAVGNPDLFTQTPVIGQDFSLSGADQLQLKEVERSFDDAGIGLHETQKIIQEAALVSDNQSLIRHLDFAYRPWDIKPAQIESEQFIDAVFIENPSPVELTPIIRSDQTFTLTAFLPQVEYNFAFGKSLPELEMNELDERITELAPQRQLDPAKISTQQELIASFIERYHSIEIEYGSEKAKEIISPLIAGLDIFVKKEKLEVVKDEEAAGNRVHGIKKGVEAKDQNIPIAGQELVNALTTNTNRIEGKLRSSEGIDGSLVETITLLLQLKPEKPADIETKAKVIIDHNPPGEISSAGRNLSIKEVDSIVTAKVAYGLAAFLKKIVKG